MDEEEVRNAINDCNSMREASIKAGVPFETFKRYAKKYNLYNPNQSGKGISKKAPYKYSTEDILSNKVYLQSSKLKVRLLAEGLLDEICAECGIGNMWNGKKLALQLDHADGNNRNNELSNLRMLCPNCHTQTSTWGAKNKNHKKSKMDV